MQNLQTLAVILFYLFNLSSCQWPWAWNESYQVVAKVNGEAISIQDYRFYLDHLKAEEDVAPDKAKLVEILQRRALNEAILSRLLFQESEKMKIGIAKEEVESRLSNLKDGYPPGGFEEMLAKQNSTEAFLKKRIEEQLLVEKISGLLFSTETMVSDDEMKSYFTEHQSQFHRPERVHAFQIVVPTLQEAEKIKEDLASNKTSFESAARQYSLSPDAAKGGDIGFFAKNEKIAAFNEAFTLSVGAISKPVHSPYGVHLFKVVEKVPAKKLSFQEAREEIAKAAKRYKEAKVYKEWVIKLIKDSEIYKNEKLIRTST